MAKKQGPGVVQIRHLFNENTKLKDVPDWWRIYFEPRVMRGSFLPCWIWRARRQGHGTVLQYPTLYIPANVIDSEEKGIKPAKKKLVYAHRFIASYFWQFPDEYVVYRNCPGGPDSLCVNPNHFVISYRNDPDFA